MAAPAICSLRCLLFARFCSLFSSLLPFVFFSHPSRARPSRGLARPITSGCHRFIYSYLSLPFSFSFPYLFFLFSSFFFPPRVSEPFPPSRFLRGSRSTTLLPLRRFSLSRKMGEDVREIVQSRERERKSIRTENFRITERINLSDLFRFFFDFVPRSFKRRRFYFFSPSITRWKFVFGSETLIIGFQTAMSSQRYVRVFLSARYLYTRVWFSSTTRIRITWP